MRISDWSSDVCSSDLRTRGREIVGKSPLAVGEDRQREMMLPEHEPVALQIVRGIGEIERLARSGILGRGHLVLPAAPPFGCSRLTHEGEGFRGDKREILAEQGSPVSRASPRGLLPTAVYSLHEGRVISAD